MKRKSIMNLIRAYKLATACNPEAAAYAVIQVMGTRLDSGTFTAEDCAEIIHSVYNEELHQNYASMIFKGDF